MRNHHLGLPIVRSCKMCITWVTKFIIMMPCFASVAMGCGKGDRAEALWKDGSWREIEIMDVIEDQGECGLFRVRWGHNPQACQNFNSEYWGDQSASVRPYCVLSKDRLRGPTCGGGCTDKRSESGEDESSADGTFAFDAVVSIGAVLVCMCICCILTWYMLKPDADEAPQVDREQESERSNNSFGSFHASSYNSLTRSVTTSLQHLRRQVTTLSATISPKSKPKSQMHQYQRRVSPHEEDAQKDIGGKKHNSCKTGSQISANTKTSGNDGVQEVKAQSTAEMSGGGNSVQHVSKRDQKADLWGSFKQVSRRAVGLLENMSPKSRAKNQTAQKCQSTVSHFEEDVEKGIRGSRGDGKITRKQNQQADLWGSFRKTTANFSRNPIRKFSLSKYRPVRPSYPPSQISCVDGRMSGSSATIATVPSPPRHNAPQMPYVITRHHLIQPAHAQNFTT
eukprot:gnl/MRDRNA2_/MRDRNA2_79298_c0_seq1.p1 gnl/MRDRNA2_/MRDRNA2_79298_c0~~gnl/MRDRNA2_/MRDRNA2_79298_c0_seq1.p1  ORF type:complete len:452 (-),score=64.86 gnl/MRDRNA2_/MRDRNA2_79298_c0_seq1:229-1584(-)